MTFATISARARQILQDTAEPYRWQNNELRSHLQAAIYRLHKLAPTTRYIDGGLVDSVAVPEENSAAIAIDERYGEALSLYVAYLCYFNDATDTVNAERASACLTRAEGLMAQ